MPRKGTVRVDLAQVMDSLERLAQNVENLEAVDGRAAPHILTIPSDFRADYMLAAEAAVAYVNECPADDPVRDVFDVSRVVAGYGHLLSGRAILFHLQG